jgi:antitoxin ParD1/3/4
MHPHIDAREIAPREQQRHVAVLCDRIDHQVDHVDHVTTFPHIVDKQPEVRTVARSMTLNVRVQGQLGEFVAANVGEDGSFDNVSEYVRDLIRKDQERVEGERFERLKAELKLAFAAPDDCYGTLTAEDLFVRNRRRG